MTTTTTTTVEIFAPASSVWAVLTNSDWWNQAPNGVVSLSGQIAENEQLQLVSELQPKRPFKLKVLETQPGSRMIWTGGLPLRLCTGNRVFEITDPADGRCRFTMYEDFTGPLSALIIRSLPDFQESFDTFARALKATSENP